MNTIPCPICNEVPDLAIDNQYWLSCPKHGHMATGQTLNEAIENWNRYILFIEKAAI